MSLLRRIPLAPLRQVRLASSSASPVTVTSTRSNASAPLLANIEASWKGLAAEEQYEVYQQLEELQKKDWKELSIDEKKAAYFVAFGPHGPRTPINTPGNSMRVFLGTIAACLTGFGVFSFARSQAAPPPQSMTREHQEASNEYMKEQNLNPITGISSEGYKGKGMVVTYG
ncbi:cytochrome c oxidase subunit 4, partial [Tremellales sp. Uapishka_1]